MLTLTETAGSYLAQLLAQAETPEDITIRLVREAAGVFALQFDHAQPDDMAFEHENRAVLVFDTRIAQTLAGSTIDVRDDNDGPKLIIRHYLS